MSKNIIVIEPQLHLYKELKKVAIEENDNMYFISNKMDISSKYEDVLFLDLFNDYDNSLEEIKKLINTEKFYIVTANESYLLTTQKLKKDLNINKFEIDEYIAFRDKGIMKKLFKENEVNTAESYFYKTIKELSTEKENIKYPVIIKPTGGFASCGVKKINTAEELVRHLNKIAVLNKTVLSKTNNNNSGFLIEQFIEGNEYAIDTIWFDGKPIIDGIFSKGNDKGPYFPDRVYCIDPELSESIKSSLLNESYKAVRALGARSGATHTEIRIMGGVPYVIETAIRPGAGGYFYKILSKAYNVDFFKIYYYSISCDSYEEFNDKCSEFDLNPCNIESYLWYNMTLQGSGVIKNIHNIDKIVDREEVVSYELFQFPGDRVYPKDLNTSYFCWIFSKIFGENPLEKSNELAEIYDSIISIEYEEKEKGDIND
ncbi:ATP-grasp domain-containing protein [Bacillus cereus group sp. BfR-BA-01441]|uniref:ATP-grasp domain-containing protein n=1 Tax=Bacillus cereus group sp. BfR-BA-01441 TaxID=2920348 RepID=UPI001F59721E